MPEPRLTPGLAGLVSRFDLGGDAVAQLRALVEVLVCDPTAPTAIRAPRRVVDDHLADSLVALDLEPVESAVRVADLGSGVGMPGLPLAIAKPTATVDLIESNGRKCAFLEGAARRCEIPNARVVNARVEEWSAGTSRYQLVTARALDSLAVVAEYAAPLLVTGGALVAWRGRREPRAEAQATRAMAELGLEEAEVREVRPYRGAEHRHLHVILKVRDTPERFPRRPGVARKHPLGGIVKPRSSVTPPPSDRARR